MQSKDFAQLLIEIRSWSFSSARSFFKNRNFSFSYGTYILFERGERLPSAPQLTEIIRALDASPGPLLLHWAAEQFEDTDLKSIFQENENRGAPLKKEAPQAKIPQPSLDSTWVLNKKDIDEILKNPWVFEALSEIVTSYPDGVSASELSLRLGQTAEDLRDHYLKRWVGNEDILFKDGKFISTYAFVHLPATPQAEPIRNFIISNAFGKLVPIAALKRLRRVRLNAKDAALWQDRLEQTINDITFAASKGKAPGEKSKELYELILLFGHTP
jgi:hypothetical protein